MPLASCQMSSASGNTEEINIDEFARFLPARSGLFCFGSPLSEPVAFSRGFWESHRMSAQLSRLSFPVAKPLGSSPTRFIFP